MEDDIESETEQKSNEELLEELLESVNKQQDINARLKEVMEPVVKALSKRRGTSLTEEITNEIKALFIEAESLQAEGRAAFHQLFGVEDE